MKKNKRLNKIIGILAWGSLLFAFIYGKFIRTVDYKEAIAEFNMGEDAPKVLLKEQNQYILSFENGQQSNIQIGEAQGYGGILIVGVQYDSAATIERILVLDQRETVSFMTKLNSKGYFDQYKGKNLDDPLFVTDDLDAISGATVSSVGFSNAVRKASYETAETDFDLATTEPFALIFSLEGVGLQWYILPLALIGSMFIPDFYCRYFCPVGHSFSLILKGGNRFRKWVNGGKDTMVSGERKANPKPKVILKPKVAIPKTEV